METELIDDDIFITYDSTFFADNECSRRMLSSRMQNNVDATISDVIIVDEQTDCDIRYKSAVLRSRLSIVNFSACNLKSSKSEIFDDEWMILYEDDNASCSKESKCLNNINLNAINEIFSVQKDMENVAISFVKKISILDNKDKVQESIKEVYKLFQSILSNPSKELSNVILEHASKANLSLPVFIAFLAATLPFKAELSFRKSLFEEAEKMALKELGREKLDKSIFKNLQ